MKKEEIAQGQREGAKKPTISNGGAAFPVKRQTDIGNGMVFMYEEKGMTLRDYYAGQALQGLLVSHRVSTRVPHDEIAKMSYVMADEMIRARGE